MTPEPHDPSVGDDDLPGLAPHEEDLVRRLLADSAPPVGAMPAEVAARLDTVLTALADERLLDDARPPALTGADDLAARRARRHRSRVLLGLAAAAVVGVVGFGAVVLPQTGGQSDSAGSAAPASDFAREGGSAGDGPEASLVPGKGFASYDLAGPGPELRTGTLDADLARVAAQERPGDASSRKDTGAVAGYPCVIPSPVPGGEVVAVRLDGKPATLVLGPVTDGSREARVYACDDGDTPVARSTVPVR